MRLLERDVTVFLFVITGGMPVEHLTPFPSNSARIFFKDLHSAL
jgi:hypothetical protein